MPPADPHRLRDAARDLIALAELFWHVLPISDEDMTTLIEIADFAGDDGEESAA
jgi:2-phospho-L-lactate transferase/gluconeogenesis factor (CofD/UPF0052 family)